MYKTAYFNYEKRENEYFVTNDLGNYCFLQEADFERFIKGRLDPDEALFIELQNSGFLYTDKDHYVAENAGRLEQMKSCLMTGTRLFIFVLTDTCNQRCIYCQAGTAHTSQMTIETCKKAIDLAVQAPVASVTIEFQGGEPTANPDTLKFAVAYAKDTFYKHGKNVDFSIVTNLSNPNPETLQFLIDENINISTSLDGPTYLHAYNRPLAIYKSSYEAWNSGFQLYKELCEHAGKKAFLGALQTTTRKSLEYPKEIIDEYLSHGLTNLYIRPLTPLGYAKQRWDTIGYTADEFLSFYKQSIDYMIELCKQGTFVRETTASLYLERILNKVSVGHTEFRSPCGAAVGQMAINYDGQIYTCDEGRMMANMGDNIFCLGTVNNTYKELVQSPVAHTICTASCVETLPFCSDCVYSPFCAVCPVVTYGLEGDLISHEKDSYKCKLAKGIMEYLFSKLNNASSDTFKILSHWVT